MIKFLFAAIVLFGLTGCHRHSKSTDIEFVITPDATAQTVTMNCDESSSGFCHFVFSRNGTAVAEAKINTSNTITVRDIQPGTVYCAAIHRPSLENCKPTPIPEKRSTVRMSSSATGEVSD